MNWIEKIDDILARVEDTAKGEEGDLITKARGIIEDNRKKKSPEMDAHEIAYYAVRGTERDPVKDVEEVEKMIEAYSEEKAKKDLFEFAEWASQNHVRAQAVWLPRWASQTDSNTWKTTEELYNTWKKR